MKYAIVESGGKQYRAVEGGTIEVDRLPVETGANVKLEQILLIADGENVTVGMPVIKDNPVWTKVLEHFKGEKVTIFNYSPKKRIRVKTGHRQNYTRLFIEQVGGAENVYVKKEPVKKAEKVLGAEAGTESPKTKVEPAKKPAAAAKTATTKTAKKPAGTKAPAKAKTTATSSTKKTSTTKAAPKKTTTKAAPKKPAEKK